ncbi:nucleoside phosphorylase [Erysipelotrichaceae bacterium HCN-30851]
MWFYKNDKTKPIFTAENNMKSDHRNSIIQLPNTALLIYMRGIEYIKEKYESELISEHFPRFLNACPIYMVHGKNDICVLDGGRGAPMAADTIETLHAIGVKNIISVGMIGGFSEDINVGDIVIPNKAYSEEGTSLHYYESLEYSTPNKTLFYKLKKGLCNYKIAPIISTDGIFRQTFYKENLRRKKGCVGVDMETSALMSVGKYLNMKVASVLMVSDKHPLHERDEVWKWKINTDLRKQFLYQVIEVVLSI